MRNIKYLLFFLVFIIHSQISESQPEENNLKFAENPQCININGIIANVQDKRVDLELEFAKAARGQRLKAWHNCKWDKFNALKDIVSGIEPVWPYSFLSFTAWVYGRDYCGWEEKYDNALIECDHINGKDFIQGYTTEILSQEKNWIEKKAEYEQICLGSTRTDSQNFWDHLQHECKVMSATIFGETFARWENARDEL